MTKLTIIKKTILKKIKGIIVRDASVNWIIRKQHLLFDTKHKTYLEKTKKVTIRKKENTTAKIGDLIIAVSCRKLSPIVYFRQL